MARVLLFPMLNVLYFHISTSRSMCAVANMAAFCSSLISCFPGTLLRYFVNDFDMVPAASCYHWCHFCFYVPHVLYFCCNLYIFIVIIIISFPGASTRQCGAAKTGWAGSNSQPSFCASADVRRTCAPKFCMKWQFLMPAPPPPVLCACTKCSSLRTRWSYCSSCKLLDYWSHEYYWRSSILGRESGRSCQSSSILKNISLCGPHIEI